jgi:hypothetical protein
VEVGDDAVDVCLGVLLKFCVGVCCGNEGEVVCVGVCCAVMDARVDVVDVEDAQCGGECACGMP